MKQWLKISWFIGIGILFAAGFYKLWALAAAITLLYAGYKDWNCPHQTRLYWKPMGLKKE